MDDVVERTVCLFADQDDVNSACPIVEMPTGLSARSLPSNAAEKLENRMADLAETRSLPSNAAENQTNRMADLESNVADNEELDSASASDGDSSERCVAKDDEICVCCIRDNCSILSKVEYEQYSKQLTGQLAKQQSNKIVTTEADLVTWYLESIEDELHTGTHFDHRFYLICRIIDKLVREGVFVATEGQDSDDEVRVLELAN